MPDAGAADEEVEEADELSRVRVRLEGREVMVRVRGGNVRPRWQSGPSTSTQKSQTLEKLSNVRVRGEREGKVHKVHA